MKFRYYFFIVLIISFCTVTISSRAAFPVLPNASADEAIASPATEEEHTLAYNRMLMDRLYSHEGSQSAPDTKRGLSLSLLLGTAGLLLPCLLLWSGKRRYNTKRHIIPA